jgi:hypothetical protein
MKRTWRDHLVVLSVFIPACIVGVSVAIVMYVLQDLEKLETIPVTKSEPEICTFSVSTRKVTRSSVFSGDAGAAPKRGRPSGRGSD